MAVYLDFYIVGYVTDLKTEISPLYLYTQRLFCIITFKITHFLYSVNSSFALGAQYLKHITLFIIVRHDIIIYPYLNALGFCSCCCCHF